MANTFDELSEPYLATILFGQVWFSRSNHSTIKPNNPKYPML